MNEPTHSNRKALLRARRLAPLTVLMALTGLLPGCGGQIEMSLVDPAKYQYHTCVQLGREMSKLGARAQELRALYDKASRESTAVARIAYEADYLSTIGDMRLIEDAAREKNCDPPVTAASAPPAPAAPAR